jgi:uncharacterized membrane protein YcaP (DUF421 family)
VDFNRDVSRLDFYIGQESLTAIEWILRSSVSFIFLVLVAKLMGQRSISQLRFLDIYIALVLGSITASPLSDETIGLKGSLITTLVFMLLYITATCLSLKWTKFKKFLDPPPITLIKNGQIQFPNLSTARISLEYLFSELRKEKVEDIQKVSLALWEPGGTLSVFLNPQYQPLTPANMKIKTGSFTLKRPIIVEGKIDMTLLKEMEKDRTWLQNKITPHLKIDEIILATIDDNENVQVYTNLNQA